MLIWREQETTRVGYLDPHVLAERYLLDDAQAVLDAMAGLLSQLVEEVS